ncbi:hypothetical protein SISSUDRAFT_1052459 [Sistotremastrum suecicum HHB10207 ss-3]|uniref:Alpha/beta hydrolase fold-3 domain-containing protein n=1 Tax=Sistotremastrum suecicum HHB10207 ss-3 TaxID=1314776 RepID=A0A165ZUX7_9AGAM|nr:hypothetical protein SISSUDRAFT_1052459 [Sistotremastrum suecicum HHB10207 ss-3]
MTRFSAFTFGDPEWDTICADVLSRPSPPPTGVVVARIVGMRKQEKGDIENLKTRVPIPESGYTATDIRIPVKDGEIDARSYIPESTDPDERFPLLFWTHGGGFVMGNLEVDDHDNRNLCVNARIVIVSIDYRLAPEYPFPTQVDDSFAALKWVLQNPSKFSLDVGKGVLVGGLSAGGNIAAVLALLARDDSTFPVKISGQLLEMPFLCEETVYPPELKDDLQSMFELSHGPFLSRSEMKNIHATMKIPDYADPRFSVLRAASHANLPPTLIQIAGHDPLRDEAIVYGEVLAMNGVLVKTEIYPGTPHAFNLIGPHRAAAKKYRKDTSAGVLWLLEHARV